VIDGARGFSREFTDEDLFEDARQSSATPYTW